MPAVFTRLERHTREVERLNAQIAELKTSKEFKFYVPLGRHTQELKEVKDQLGRAQRLYQEMVDAALQWREKFIRLEGQANTLAGEATRATNLAEGFANQASAADHCVGALRSELDEANGQVRILQGRVRMFETSEASTIGDLRSQLEEARGADGILRAEIHRKDKDLQLLRSELERIRVNYQRTATEVDEAFNRGRAQGRSECVGDYGRGLADGRKEVTLHAYEQGRDAGYIQGRREGQAEGRAWRPGPEADGDPCGLPIKGIHLDHRKISGEFLNRAIDLYDLLHEIGEEDPHAVQFRVRNPAMTGQIVALTHALRDFHNAPCPSSEG